MTVPTAQQQARKRRPTFLEPLRHAAAAAVPDIPALQLPPPAVSAASIQTAAPATPVPLPSVPSALSTHAHSLPDGALQPMTPPLVERTEQEERARRERLTRAPLRVTRASAQFL